MARTAAGPHLRSAGTHIRRRGAEHPGGAAKARAFLVEMVVAGSDPQLRRHGPAPPGCQTATGTGVGRRRPEILAGSARLGSLSAYPQPADPPPAGARGHPSAADRNRNV